MTYPSGDEANLWMFGRDEVDLLEEEVEEIYDAQEARGHEEADMEHLVMQEQIDTEEQTERELANVWGGDLLERDSVSRAEGDEVDSSIPLRELLKEHMFRDPLYTQAYVWSSAVFRFAKEQYLSGQDRSRDMFRVYLNANMIPIKLAIGRTDACLHDPFTLHVMQKEYELALTYLERTLESLHVLTVRGYDLLIPFTTSGAALRRHLLHAIAHINQPNRPSDEYGE